MNITTINGLNVILDKKLELMLAFHALTIKKHPNFNDELDFISISPISYFEELENIIDVNEYLELIDDILKFEDATTAIHIALGMNDDYLIDEKKVDIEKISKYLGGVNLNDFTNRFKQMADKIKWDKFFFEHQTFYKKLYSDFLDFPKDLNLKDINDFYNLESQKFYFIPSVLSNGGFAFKDRLNNNYYIRGINWDVDENNFVYDKEYLLECMFHEFSHPVINDLVDKYYSLFVNIDTLFNEAVANNLPKAYRKKHTLLHEYLVRANAVVLVKKYYSTNDNNWTISNGFIYINDLIDYILNNRYSYDDYEAFFVNGLVPFINDLNKDR